MATNPPAETTTSTKTAAQEKLEELKRNAIAKNQPAAADKIEAYRISADCRTALHGSIVSYKKDDIVSDPGMIVQLKAQGIDMLPIEAAFHECPNCKSRFAAATAERK